MLTDRQTDRQQWLFFPRLSEDNEVIQWVTSSFA